MSKENKIGIEPQTVLFPSTFISVTSRFSIKIVNYGDKIMHYRWCKYSNDKEEKETIDSYDIYNAKQRNELATLCDFKSDVYTINPLKGEIWPKRSEISTIEFTPQVAHEFIEHAYLLDIDSNVRYQVTFKGQGLPPEARFDSDTINVGQIPLETVSQYEVVLRNTGKVEVDYEIRQNNKSGLKFEFFPSTAKIPVGGSQKISIKFYAIHVGQFTESFLFIFRGSIDFHPSFTIYGKVVGPDYIISPKVINFEEISYGFLYTKTFEIENRSDIAFDYKLRFLQDSTFSPREFTIIPSEGTISKYSKQIVTVEFIPITIMKYSVQLALDIMKVGKAITIIPIYANCLCPTISLQESDISFDQIFIQKEYEKKLVLINESDYPAKFEFILPEETNVSQARISVAKVRGTILGKQELPITLFITPLILGPINLTGYIRIYGSDDPPIQFTIRATSTGPSINLSTNAIHFGNVTVLKNNASKVVISNNSLIKAVLTTSIQSETNVFSCEPTSAEIEPNEQLTLKVIATLDDTIYFTGKLILNFVNLNPIKVDLTATGIGSTIVSSVPMDEVNFGYILNELKNPFNFQITNHGRRPQELRWTQSKPKIDERALNSFQFNIVPETVVIGPHSTIDYQFVASSSIPTNFSVLVTCNATLGRSRIELFKPSIKGAVIKPLLQFSQKEVEFVHRHDAYAEEKVSTSQKVPSVELMPSQQKTVTVTNQVKIPLKISIDVSSPFSVQPNKIELQPQESIEIKIVFNASFKQDFISEVINRKLTFTFKDHPQHLYVNVKGVYIFPNLSFSPSTTLNFGNLMINTEQTKEVIIKSSSDAKVEWNWQLVTDDKNCDLCRIFDVYPTRGQLEGGQTDSVHFSFFAYGNENGKSAKYNATAICHIVGGPDYVIQLNGAAAAILYKLNPLKIDFGYRMYDSTLTHQFQLTNLSDVSINYTIIIPKGNKFAHFYVTPSEGTVNANSTATMNISLVSGLPIEYNENFLVQIGHFEEIKVPIHVVSRFSQFMLSIPRMQTDLAYKMATEEASSSSRQIMITKSGLIIAEEEHNNEEEEEEAEPKEKRVDFSEFERRIIIEKLNDKSANFGRRNRRGLSHEVFNGFILSQYLMDIGSITIGEVRSFDIEFTSITQFPISYELKTNVLKGTGFSVDPSSAKDIPTGAKIPMKLIFDTAQRTIDNIGNLEYDIRFQLTENIGFSILLRTKLILPNLGLSKNHFDFGEVIVGQLKTMTLQLQNMNSVNCEFTFGEPQPIQSSSRLSSNLTKSKNEPEKVEEKSEEKVPQIFITNPSNGILPPASFMNIELTFIPLNGTSYAFQIPIEVKHNPLARFITMSGIGVQLRIEFDPPNLKVPPVLPFSEPSNIEVQMINPTNYQLEVFSYHFDFDLFCQHFTKKEIVEDPNNVTFTQNSAVNKFSLCVIVHGPHMSGCSIAAKSIAQYLNVPVISLKDVWKNLIENKENSTNSGRKDGKETVNLSVPPAADFTAAFFTRISQPDCSDGFVVDSLYAFQENHETDQFITQSLKAKNCYDDALKNPFQGVPHNISTGVENALSYILAALDGHYIFFVGLRTSFELVDERVERIKSEERKKQKEAEKQEEEALFNMTEEEYAALTEEQKNEVDEKRKSLRKKIVKSAQDESTDENSNDKSKHSHRSSKKSKDKKEKEPSKDGEKSTGRKSHHHHRSKDESGSKKDSNSSSQPSETQSPAKPESKKRKGQIPTDPNEYSVMLFNLTVGSICNKIKESTENFNVVDPKTLIHKVTIESPHVNEEEEINDKNKDEQQQKEAEVVDNDDNNDDFELKSFRQINAVILKEDCSINDLQRIPVRFIPSIQKLKESAFTEFIPPEKVEMNKSVPLPTSKYEECPPFFYLEVDDVERELPNFDEQDLQPKAKSATKKTTKTVSSSSSKQNAKKKSSGTSNLRINFDTKKLTGRWILPPNSRQKIVVIFDPTVIGSYKNDLLFGISNCKCEMMRLHCFGVCDNPNICRDLRSIFNRCVNHADNKTSMSYVTDCKEFMFGPVLMSKEKLAKNAAPLYNETIHLKNTSPFNTKVSLTFNDNNNSNRCTFVADPSSVTIEPDQKVDIKVGVHPTAIDTFKNTLIVTVEDQPEPLFINFSAESSIPSIEPSTTNLDFDKLLLKQTRSLNLELKNTSKLATFWKLKNAKSLSPQVEFNIEEGSINPRCSATVKVTFTSAKPIVIKKQINLEILDKSKTKVHNSIPINISAESFDVMYDFQYPPKMDHLQFGVLKVLQSKMLSCTLKNKGKFPVNFKFLFDSKIFQVSPSDGTLNVGDKPAQINFTFKGPKVVSYINAKGLSLAITDPITNTQTSVLPIPFSCETMYSAFSLLPTKLIDFGPVSISTTATKQIVLKNEGRFAFDFEVLGQSDDLPPTPPTSKASKGKKAAPPPKPKAKKNVNHIVIGNFVISPSSAVLQPGQSSTIDIDFQSSTSGDNNAIISFKISDINPKIKDDQLQVKLMAKNIVPEIDTKSMDKIFPGIDMSIRYDIEKNNRTAFLEDEQVLHFQPLLVSQHSTVDMTLINVQPVAATIDLSIKPKGRVTSSFPFDISEKTVTLEPNTSKTVQIGFNPNSCDNFIGFFEGVVRGSPNESKLFKFTVEGVGSLPQFIIAGGMDKSKGTNYVSNLGSALVGFTKEKSFVITNNGFLPSTIKISEKPNPDFEIFEFDKYEEFILQPRESQTLKVILKPQKPRKAQLDLTLSVLDNPKVVAQLTFTGEGSLEDIIFEGLNTNDDSLAFKDSVVGRQQTTVFSMRNVGNSDIRFLWMPHNELNFIPHTGHLKVGKTKQVKAVFFTDHVIKPSLAKVACQVTNIELNDPDAPDWDDTMKVVKFVPKSSLNPEQQVQPVSAPTPEKLATNRKNSIKNVKKESELMSPKESAQSSPQSKAASEAYQESSQEEELVRVIEVKEEPAYSVVTGSKPKEMSLKANIVADMIKYQIDTSDITFLPTMMYERRISEIKLTNTCLIRFDYSWRIINLVCLRTNYALNRGPPFSVEPVTGYIEPGQTKTFKVVFEPEEVDDFTADIRCDIPFLSQSDPPIIHVSGFSRRPLCHFITELSDYLTSGRRNPDYTDPLPDDVKVIELFAKGVGEKLNKRLEMINPTSSPYEVNWQYIGEGPTPISCDTPSFLVSSGKKQSTVFEFVPKSVKTIESLWEFQIPEHDVRVPFLFVGKIMPKL